MQSYMMFFLVASLFYYLLPKYTKANFPQSKILSSLRLYVSKKNRNEATKKL